MTYFYAKDAEAMAVVIRYTECVGEDVTKVVPVNDGFVISTTGDVDINSHTNLQPFKAGLHPNRTFWQEIVTVDESALQLVGITT